MLNFQRLIDPEETRELLCRLIRSKSLNPPGDVCECAVRIVEGLKRRKLPPETVEEKPGIPIASGQTLKTSPMRQMNAFPWRR